MEYAVTFSHFMFCLTISPITKGQSYVTNKKQQKMFTAIVKRKYSYFISCKEIDEKIDTASITIP